MTKATDGLNTAHELAKPSRRRALTLLASAAPIIATGSALVVSANTERESGIAKWFAEWQIERRQIDVASAELSQAEDRASALYPDHPNVLKWENAPSRWQIWTLGHVDRRSFSSGHYITLENARLLAAGKLGGCPDEWTAEVLEAAERWQAATEAADEMSGVKAAEHEWDRCLDAVRNLAQRITAITPLSIADVQMQILAVQDQHEGVQIGPLEESLFASILAAPSALVGRTV